MIWWHGVSGDDVGVVVERYPDVIIPNRKQEKISVPGRSGDLLIQQDAFENVRQSYDIYISADRCIVVLCDVDEFCRYSQRVL